MYITDQLDPDLDLSTFAFTEVGFLDWRAALEPCQTFDIDFQDVTIDLSPYYPDAPTVTMTVNASGVADAETGQVRWEFHAFDPATGEVPEYPRAGFLPPITDSGWEFGWVGYTVNPQPDLASGTRIENQCWVTFDLNPPNPAPPAGPFVNTLDAVGPGSEVGELAPVQTELSFPVAWAGEDDAGGSGVRGYDVWVSDNDGPFTLWLADTAATSSPFAGEDDHHYAFHSVARDNVGHVESIPLVPDAATTVSLPSVVAEAGPDKTIAAGGSCTLDGSASGGLAPYSYGWSPTEGLSDPATAQPLASPAATMTYTLTVTDELGQTDTDAATVTVISAPVADFTGSPTVGFPPLTVTFTDASSNGPTSWSWDFGDGGTSIAPQPTHEYTEIGSYTVALTAASEGGSDTETKERYILVTFPDVPFAPEYWALRQILACVDAGIVQGYPIGNYAPAEAVTRAQMAVYISRALAIPTGDAAIPDPEPPPSFSDVPAEHWAYKWIEHAVSRNVVQGYPGGSYHPEREVTRDQMAVYVARAFQVPM